MLAPQKKKNLKINIVPLIDIIFLMLVFFMLATNFDKSQEVNFSIDKNLNSSKKDNKILFIKLDKKKGYAINEKNISKNNFNKEVLKIWDPEKYNQVVILNDKESTIETLISTIEILKENNITNVNFADEFRNP